MSYSDDSDLLKQFSVDELSKLSGNQVAQGVNSERTAEARRQADTLIDAYLMGQISIPFTTVPEIINQISIELTIANLYEYAFKNSTIPNTITWRKLETMKLLKDIKNGVILIDSEPPDTRPTKSIITNKSENDIIFTKDLLAAM